MNRRNKSQGFTLVELLIALGLGLLVAAAATQLFVTNLMGFNLQRGMSDVQDNGRFALDFINRDVRQAGIRPAGLLESTLTAVVTDVGAMPGATASLLTSDGVTTTGLGESDQLVIQRMILRDTVDCEGNLVEFDDVNPGNDTYIVSRYFLRADAASGAASALACDGGWHDKATGVLNDIGDAGVVLMGSVENMQVQLGIGTAGVPTQYLRPDEYALLAMPRPRVLVVRLGALVVSVDSAGGQLGDAPDLSVLDALVNDIPADGRIRRVFVTSIALRNEL